MHLGQYILKGIFKDHVYLVTTFWPWWFFCFVLLLNNGKISYPIFSLFIANVDQMP